MTRFAGTRAGAAAAIRRWRERGEAGRDERANEAISFLIVMPMLFALLFGIIEMGFAFKTRMEVAAVVQDITRGAAANGGNCFARAGCDSSATSGTTAPWNVQGKDALWSGGHCTFSACSSAPNVTCTPDVANAQGDTVTCSAVYHYQPLTSLFSSASAWFGLNTLLGTYTVTFTSEASTGQNSS